MTLVIKPGLRLRQTWQPMDPDAAVYIAAVEAADGQALEEKTKIAIDNFVLGCKADGIWNAIKASCILAGARTLSGALVPLVGAAPTSFNFAGGDYSRKTGLIGDGSTKYLNLNRNNNADPQDSKHGSFYLTAATTVFNNGRYLVAGDSSGSDFHIATDITALGRLHAEINYPASTAMITSKSSTSTGFIGANRSGSQSITFRAVGSNETMIQASGVPRSFPTSLFACVGEVTRFTNGRIAFYSIGESLDLALLDARVTALINAFAAAIP